MAALKSKSKVMEKQIRLPDEIFGHARQLDVLRQQFSRGQAAHAWLFTGVQGVGKASLALAAALKILSQNETKAQAQGFEVDEAQRRLVEAGAHPDFHLLRPMVDPKTGKLRTEISVEQIRDLKEAMYKTPSIALNRVAIIDALDQMNVNGANALLKLLEEPPARAYLFLVCHNPGQILPTIASRCTKLAFRCLSKEELLAWLKSRDDLMALSKLSPDALADLGRGSPGVLESLIETDLLELEQAVLGLLSNKPRGGHAYGDVAALAHRIAKLGEGSKQILKRSLFDWMHKQARLSVHVGSSSGELVDWSSLWSKVQNRFDRVASLNLDERGLWTEVLFELSVLDQA